MFAIADSALCAVGDGAEGKAAQNYQYCACLRRLSCESVSLMAALPTARAAGCSIGKGIGRAVLIVLPGWVLPGRPEQYLRFIGMPTSAAKALPGHRPGQLVIHLVTVDMAVAMQALAPRWADWAGCFD
jgi:hypothetical protein